jgi:phage tail tape-measure protein
MWSGERSKRRDADSFAEIRADDIEHAFQLAVKWRRRIKVRSQKLSDCSLEVMWEHVDNLIKAATAWRGQYLANAEKVRHVQ